MTRDRSDEVLKRHLKSATEEERRAIARALLTQDHPLHQVPAGEHVPRWVIWISRLAAASLVLYYAFRVGLNWNLSQLGLFLLLPFVVACSPNWISRATGRISIGQVARRPSPPRLALALAWLVLLLPLLLQALQAL